MNSINQCNEYANMVFMMRNKCDVCWFDMMIRDG